ncbi:MAG: hypothetical protein ABW110_19785, partial [Steroidobacteraceae bacterium]
LETHDSSKVPFAPNVRRWEIGLNTGDGIPSTRKVMDGVPDIKLTDRRYFVDEQTDNVFLFDVLRVASVPTTVPGTDIKRPPGPASLHHAERWKVEKGWITEIEAIFFFEAGTMLAPSAQPMNGLSIGSNNFPYLPLRNGDPKSLKNPPLCTDDTRECMIQTAKSYIDGIMTYDLSKVPVASDWIRVEQGKVTGTGKGGTPLGPLPKSMNWIGSHDGTRYFVDEQSNDVIIFTMYRSSGLTIPKYITQGEPVGPVPVSMHMAERFRVEKGLITEIEEVFSFNKDMKATNWPY